MENEFEDCISKVISRLYPGPPELERQLREWIMSGNEAPGPSVESWLKDKTNREISRSDFGLLKDFIYISIAALQKESCSRTIGLPGYGYPIHWVPSYEKCFPAVIGETGVEFTSPALLVREICMLKVIEDITNEPGWWLKVRNDEVAETWKKEILRLEWRKYLKYADFTRSMANACITELRSKADLYEKTGLIPVLDCSACVLKSDKLISHKLKYELIAGANKLENDFNNIKSCDNSILDLIDPSLYPLVYGRSRILPDRTISLVNCLEACGNGDITTNHAELESDKSGCDITYPLSVTSLSFQWLPCDVDIDRDGNAKIVSYINNLHPSEHADIYSTIEKFIYIALPAWDILYQWPEKYFFRRLHIKETSYFCNVPEICGDNRCDPSNMPMQTESHHEASDSSLNAEAYNKDEDDVYFLYEESKNGNWYGNTCPETKRNALEEWFNITHPLPLPEPKWNITNSRLKASDVCRANFFAHRTRRIQVITKLTTIHLTPENPDYKGGMWELDGQLNEHIVSTARFYYDCNNTSSSYLYFRSLVNRDDIDSVPGADDDDYLTMERAFGVSSRTSMFQDIGRVRIRPGGTVFYSNLYQHRDGPFSLVDRSRPGHCKFLTLFLVDPAVTIISTANVPPQQKHWWTKSKVHHQGMKIVESLPPELRKMVNSYVDMPIDYDEAEKIREELLNDRAYLKGELYRELERWRFGSLYG